MPGPQAANIGDLTQITKVQSFLLLSDVSGALKTCPQSTVITHVQ